MNTKNINLKYKLIDGEGTYNVFETLEVGVGITVIDIEGILRKNHNKEIQLISYSENYEEIN